MRSLPLSSVLLLALFLANTGDAEDSSTLNRKFSEAVESGAVVGAQVVSIIDGEVTLSGSFGTVEPDSEKAVDDETVFLIGSCSKPFASVCLLSLMEDPSLEMTLDTAIERWLPAFANKELVKGRGASRSPTVEELLNHRAGLFSQKVKITREQARWLYRFDHSLMRSVEEISRFPLLAEPGTRYAYSGAGYCVLGRIAELSTEKDFEMILQESISKPIGLERTTYFPYRFLPDATVAVGGQRQKAPHQLGADHTFPLVGGSLYSTATEMAKFGDAVVQEWSDADQGPLKTGQAGIKKLAKVHPESVGYGLGWAVTWKKGEPFILSHSGSLQSYRAWIGLNLESGTCLAACWTIGLGKQAVPFNQSLQKFLLSM